MKELSLGWSKGGHGHLREIYFPVLFYNYMYFRTLITGCLIEGGCLMAVQLYFFYKVYDYLKVK